MNTITNYDAHKIESEILKFWDKNNVRNNINQKNKGNKSFYFLDGPPYTSGKVHLGHAWNKSLKDCILRYKRAQGFDVWDRAGYDMHGLPTELGTEKALGIKNKDDIPKYGVSKFVKACKDFAVKNMLSMNEDFKRIGIWMDFENAYQPITKDYIEGEWWLVKKAHENKRLYEGQKTMHWCGNCETSLAKHELEYENVTDTSIFLKFPVVNKKNEYLIIWTTTPWTIPFNLGVMVNPNLEYVKAKVDNEVWIVAKGLSNVLISSVANKKFKIIEEFKGKKLEGLKYIHPLEKEISDFKKLKNIKKLHSVVLSSEFVDLSAGSGLVHMAPGCGPEDYEVGHRNGIPPFNNLDQKGVFPKSMGGFFGLKAKKDDSKFIEALDKTGMLIATSPVNHDYAHCWRCKSPVIFRTTTQWFFKVEDIIDQLRKENKKIKWVPDYAGTRQFDSWLANLRDNGITRQRYWGTPLPIWKCKKCGDYDVFDSVKDIEKKSGQKLSEDLHIPFIDKIKYKCKCGNTKERIPDILDVWIDSGSASWNCLYYPHKKDLFNRLFPADFIIEGIDQIRGWFNLLHVAGFVSMKKPSFKACYMHGFINDSQGRKMSKSLGNYILPAEVIDKYGSDTMRYYMIGASNPGINMNYNFEDMKIKNKNLVILWNLHKYLIDSANALEINPSKLSKVKLDTEEKFILSKLNSSIEKLTEIFDGYRLNETPWVVEELYLELSRTYIQLVREKLATGSEDEKKTVLYTIYNILFETLKMFTPIAPFISEEIYQNIKQAFGLKEKSISLCQWPKADKKQINKQLEQDFDVAKDVIGSILNAREKAVLGVRWPVKEVIITTPKKEAKKAIEHLKDLIMLQTNVKKISVVNEFKGIEKVVKPNYKTLGPEFGELAPKIISKIAEEDPQKILKEIGKDGYKINVSRTDITIKKEHIVVETTVSDGYTYSESKDCEVFIDVLRTKELDAEGYYREISRRIQSLRKKAGLQKADRINTHIEVSEDLEKDLNKFTKELKEKIGANTLDIRTDKPKGTFDAHETEKIKKENVKVWFSKV